MTKLVFLGTGGMLPTKERNVQSLYLDHNGEGILLDCGEGTQRQLQLAGLNLQKISIILISHWHGDHVLGLPGLLQTMNSFAHESKELHLYGPTGSKNFLDSLLAGSHCDMQLNLTIHEIDAPQLQELTTLKDFSLHAINLEHSIPCLGFKFTKNARRVIQKNKLPKGLQGPLVGELQSGNTIEFAAKTINPEDVSYVQEAQSVGFIFDTLLCPACDELATGCSVLIAESSLTHDLLHKAKEFHHLTAFQAGELASRTGVEHLILTHFSQRYKDVGILEQDAKKAFTNVLCAEDFLEIEFDF